MTTRKLPMATVVARLRTCRLLSATSRSRYCTSSPSPDLRHSFDSRLLPSFSFLEEGSTSSCSTFFRVATGTPNPGNALSRETGIEISSSSSHQKKISRSQRVYKPVERGISSESAQITSTSATTFPSAPKTRSRRSSSCLFLAQNLSDLLFSKSFSNQTATMSTYSIVEKGTPNTMDYRLYFNGPNGYVSIFHDIPLYADTSKTVFNMVVEIPRWTNHKMEICKEEKLNPIKQDVKKGKVRFVKNLFPHHGYIWNYGAFPQTWEDPNHTEPETNTKGDSDPIDVCEIGSKIHKRGAVVQVKVLGIMCLIDEGETDWKVLAIDVKDPLASEINDVEDIEKKMPGFLKATYEWFRYYKVPDGKPENQFAFNGEAKNKAYALKVVEETHKQWQNLMNKSVDAAGISCENTSVAGSPYKFASEEAKIIVDNSVALSPAADLPSDVDQWHYISK